MIEMVLLLGVSLCGMMGEKKHCRKDPNIAEIIGTWQIDPKSCNIAGKQIDLFFLPCGGYRYILWVYEKNWGLIYELMGLVHR